MIAALIRWSVKNRFFVVIGALALLAAGVVAVRSTPVDALPRSVRRAGDHPHALSGPGAADRREPGHLSLGHHHAVGPRGPKTVRGYSFFGDSFVYVIFEDGADLYWARSRVLEYLSQVQGRMPEGAKPALGPDATGVGWVYEIRLGRPDRSS
ncbi:MAG: efflux RND transporter permease subunit [Caulobacteraceae bacterium]